MGMIDNLKAGELTAFKRRTRTLEAQSPAGFTSVTKGRLRVASAEGLVVEGSQRISGSSSVTGTQTISGTQNVSGSLNLTGNMSVSGGGKITVGSLVIDPAVGAGGGAGRFTAPVAIGFGTPLVVVNNLAVLNGLDVDGPKSFRMAHPLKDGWWLRHGATESPVSGTEYTGRAELGPTGEATVSLPEYFEALNKPGNRTVQVTPVGSPFPVGAAEVVDGTVTIYGEPGRAVFWLVKAERRGGDFSLEEEIASNHLLD